MAKKLGGYDFDRTLPNYNSKYPWDEWLDGSIWEITCPKDFQVSSKSFIGNCYNAAKVRDLKIRLVKESDIKIILQAIL